MVIASSTGNREKGNVLVRRDQMQQRDRERIVLEEAVCATSASHCADVEGPGARLHFSPKSPELRVAGTMNVQNLGVLGPRQSWVVGRVTL